MPVWLGETGENTDAWIGEMRALAEARGIGWAFWPYKKMDATSAVVSFERPAGWDEVIALGLVNAVDYEARRKTRPAPERARAILQQLLANIRVERCRRNEGYIRALTGNAPLISIAFELIRPGAPSPARRLACTRRCTLRRPERACCSGPTRLAR